MLRVAASCDLATLGPDDSCIPLWANDDGAGLAGRARFFAWASRNAAVLDFDDTADATACAATLRERALGADSPIALVLGHDALALAELADRAGLEASAHRFGRALAANERENPKRDLESLGRKAPSGRIAPWLAARSSTVVVVPRLSAMTRSRELVARIEEAARGRPMTWRHRPRATP